MIGHALGYLKKRLSRLKEVRSQRRAAARMAAGTDWTMAVVSKAGGLGDELMALGAIQAARRTFPEGRFIFHARHALLFAGEGEHLQIVRHVSEAVPQDALVLTYDKKLEVPLIGQMAQQLSAWPQELPIALPRRGPEELPAAFPRDVAVIVIQTVASEWTPNKQWPLEHWQTLLGLLETSSTASGGVRILEVGQRSIFETAPAVTGYISLVGQTSLEQYLACIQHAAAFVGPVSSGIHLAHAYGVDSVVVAGGYEAANYPYPRSRQFGSELHCAPCWLRTECPYERKCLSDIQPGRVHQAIVETLARRPHP